MKIDHQYQQNCQEQFQCEERSSDGLVEYVRCTQLGEALNLANEAMTINV